MLQFQTGFPWFFPSYIPHFSRLRIGMTIQRHTAFTNPFRRIGTRSLFISRPHPQIVFDHLLKRLKSSHAYCSTGSSQVLMTFMFAHVRHSIIKLLLSLYLILNCTGYSSRALMDQVLSLPGVESAFKSRHFSGFLNITSSKNIHYMYIESEGDPSTDPVIFWTNGGPGCSGLLALFTEFGPWRPTVNGGMEYNPFTWVKKASIVFLEQPVGVGFSYSSKTDKPIVSDYQSATDNVLVVKSFFNRFPERKSNDFHVASESYGGHYIPQWTLKLFEDGTLLSQFKGFLVGNPFTGYNTGTLAMMVTAWGLQLFPKTTWDRYVRYGCQDLSLTPYKIPDICWDIMSDLYAYIDNLNPYALTWPICVGGKGYNQQSFSATGIQLTSASDVLRYPSAQAEAQMKIMKRGLEYMLLSRDIRHTPTQSNDSFSASTTIRIDPEHQQQQQQQSEPVDIQGLLPKKKPVSKSQPIWQQPNLQSESGIIYDACTRDRMTAYLNQLNVQKALNVISKTATSPKTWDFCTDVVNVNWPLMDIYADTTPLYGQIYNHPRKPKGFKMLVFSGDVDGVCATVGTQHWIYNIPNAQISSLWKVWFLNQQVAGFTTKFLDSFSFITVRFAGHEVPAYQPERAASLFDGYLSGDIFETAESLPVPPESNNVAQSSPAAINQALLITIIATSVLILLILAALVYYFRFRPKRHSVYAEYSIPAATML